MIYSCLATAAILVGVAHGVENKNLGTSSRCANYIRMTPSTLYPVNECYQENTDPEQVSDVAQPYIGGFEQNYMYRCQATDNGTEACLVRMGVSCGNLVYETGTCYPCNGEEDQCECSVGAQGETGCQLYEKTEYELTWGFNGYYCNQKQNVLTRYVVNMCIQGSSTSTTGGGQLTYGFTCGGIDGRSGTNKDYAFLAKYYANDECTSSNAPVPTAMPTSPSLAPTDNPTATGDSYTNYGDLYCSESVCDGVAGPKADGVDRLSAFVAIAFAAFVSLM